MQYPEKISKDQIDELEIKAFEGQVIVISEKDIEYKKAIKYLSRQQVIGFDTETKPSFQAHAPRHTTALLQLSGKSKTYLFRLHDLGIPKDLADIMSNPFIIKVGAAITDDVRGLQKFRKFKGKNFLDLQKLVEQYGIKDKSVKKMACILLGYKISKSQQLSNWEASSYTEAQKRYASTDSWICREMFIKLLDSEMVEPEENE